jgi:hypothetical protein
VVAIPTRYRSKVLQQLMLTELHRVPNSSAYCGVVTRKNEVRILDQLGNFIFILGGDLVIFLNKADNANLQVTLDTWSLITNLEK